MAGSKSGQSEHEGSIGKGKQEVSAEPETSNKLLDAVRQVHEESKERNKTDSGTDNAWAAADGNSIAKAEKTKNMAQNLDNFLTTLTKEGRTFSGPEARKLAVDFIKQLRIEREDHQSDRKGAVEYFGKTGLNEDAQNQVRAAGMSITDSAKKLQDPASTEAEKTALLDKIEAATKGIDALMGKSDLTSKDVKDMKSESGVILADIAALKGANLSPEEKQLLYKDIISKAGVLIPQELGDLKPEMQEIDHDNKAIKLGEILEAQLKGLLMNPADMKTRIHTQERLHDLTQVLNDVIEDRKSDMIKEPLYAKNNAADSSIDEEVIAFIKQHRGK